MLKVYLLEDICKLNCKVDLYIGKPRAGDTVVSKIVFRGENNLVKECSPL